MYSYDGGNISLTRGDTLHIPVVTTGYELQADDMVEMTVRQSTEIGSEVIFRIVGDAEHILHIRPEHTANLSYGSYKYDIQATLVNGDVVTYGPYKFKILPEVTYDG